MDKNEDKQIVYRACYKKEIYDYLTAESLKKQEYSLDNCVKSYSGKNNINYNVIAENHPDPEEETNEEDFSSFSEETSHVSAEINELFDGSSSVGKTAEKVNQTLDQLSDRIRRFPQGNDEDDTEQRQD